MHTKKLLVSIFGSGELCKLIFSCQVGYFATFTLWFIASHSREEEYSLLKTSSRATQTVSCLQDSTLTTHFFLIRTIKIRFVGFLLTWLSYSSLNSSAIFCQEFFYFLESDWLLKKAPPAGYSSFTKDTTERTQSTL